MPTDLKRGRVTDATKVWASVLTNTEYLAGILTLEYSLRKNGTKYPFIVLYTDSLPEEAHAALEARGILKQPVPYLKPSMTTDLSLDRRLYDAWTKLVCFSLYEYEHVVLLDCDMMALHNMDELMDVELDPPEMEGNGNRVFGSTHACVCNPLNRPHYPEDWIPANCGWALQHGTPELAQTIAPPIEASFGLCNTGIIVTRPSEGVYKKITDSLATSDTSDWIFADQSLLSEVFQGRWAPLPYIYNALKTKRWKGVHDAIWRDDRVKNIHYFLTPKPWDETPPAHADPTHAWWCEMNEKRKEEDKASGVTDGF
ncbi:glycosyl transferase family protein [Aspergillus ruber CBS 135680]|uniref:Glycosyl transferase family protein n=1 Tax=Aspergillus ruber (strain CBS 135680) TaxID=1388766 RepID=A0A017S563_ASPRC|nr:glycosyl transferase family protein [Aspergillus ruber CBS 135680]EYE92163.1 glycosyl transferase family protein [Aspergillus ruber CBS 135680]